MSSQVGQTVQVCDSLLQEHRAMEALLDELDGALSRLQVATGIQPVQAVMDRIVPEMNTHFACEEQALFPAVSPYHPMVLMEVEHEELIALRGDLLQHCAQPGLSEEGLQAIRDLGGRFIQEMLDHIGREDAGIFPTCERALSIDEKEAVIEKMAQIRRDAQQSPTPSIQRPLRTLEVVQMDLSQAIQRPIFSSRLMESDGLEVKHLIVQGGQSLAAHWSPKEIVLICMQGSGVLMASENKEAQEIPLMPGTVVRMSPQLRHGVAATSDCHLLLLLQPMP
jgi:hemerythrin-like domain-containing protein